MREKKNHLPKWPVIVVVIIILLLFMLNPACRYFYTRDFVARSDEQLAEMLAHDFEAAGITNFEKPIYFIGSGTTRTNASCLDLSDGKYDLYSVFAVSDALDLSILESSRHIVAYLNDLGYAYAAPTSEHFAAYEAEINAALPLNKTFPWYESIAETEHCIIVQLSIPPLSSAENPESALHCHRQTVFYNIQKYPVPH